MDRYSFSERLTPAARELLRPDEALVLDWHRLAVCCAGAGEMGLYATNERTVHGRRGLDRERCGSMEFVRRSLRAKPRRLGRRTR